MAFVKSSGVSGTAAARSGAAAAGTRRVVDILASGQGAAATAAALAATTGGGGSPAGAGRSLYAGEAGDAAGAGALPDLLAQSVGGGGGGTRGGDQPPGPLTLPNGMLEFQVRLTADEHARVMLARRRAEAEAKYFSRLTAAKDRERAIKGDRFADADASRAADNGPYEDPPRMFQRSP